MTKEIVINSCFGGFGLSPVAEKRYLELIGKPCFFYRQTRYKHDGGIVEYTRVVAETAGSFYYTVTEDLGEITDDIGGTCDSKHPDAFWYSGDLQRDDPILIQVIKELGSEKASGSCSKLTIVVIPDDVEWEISEYDGNESVEEKHRSWG